MGNMGAVLRRGLNSLAILGLAGLPLAGMPKVNRSAPPKAIGHNKPVQAMEAGEDGNGVVAKDTELCVAIAANQVDVVKLMLQSPKVDVNKRGTHVDGFNDSWERTPLILAAGQGQTEIVELLLNKGADVNARDRVNGSPLERGATALMFAVNARHLETVQALFNHGKKPDVNLRNRNGNTALWLAAAKEELGILRFLLGKGAKVNLPDNQGRSVLTTTFLHKHHEVLDALVASGADINWVDEGGITPLMEAVLINQNQKALVLGFLGKFLTFKPKLDLQQVRPQGGGDSALLLAARFGFKEAIQLLLDQGANINLQSLSTGRTPLATAALAHQVEAARYLMKRGAKTELADKSAYTPLLLAVLQGDGDMVQALVEGGANPDFRAPGHNLTPLVVAAANLDPFKHGKCLNIIKVLLNGKADINFQASDGRTALLAAAASSNQGQGLATATLLLDRGAHPDLANQRGETALMLSAGNGNEKVLQLLLKKGARVELKTGAGETVMSFAQRSGKRSLVALLEAKGAKVEAPVVLPKVLVKDLVGTWVGQQDGLPQALFTLVLKQDNTFDFVSRFTPEALKQLPKGSVNPVIASQEGTYTVNNNFMVLSIKGAAPLSRQWKLTGGVLVLDNIIKLKRK